MRLRNGELEKTALIKTKRIYSLPCVLLLTLLRWLIFLISSTCHKVLPCPILGNIYLQKEIQHPRFSRDFYAVNATLSLVKVIFWLQEGICCLALPGFSLSEMLRGRARSSHNWVASPNTTNCKWGSMLLRVFLLWRKEKSHRTLICLALISKMLTRKP